MKKKNLFIAIICLAMATLYGCGSSGNSDSSKDKITVTSSDGKVYESYQECCAANDYEAAHQFLAKLQNSESEAYSYGEAKEYVFKNEALFLMSQDDETAKKRIIYLLKEEGNNDDHVSMLIDLAIENDDEAFVKKLANQYSERASKKSLQKLMSYLSEKPTEGNMEFVKNLLKRLGKDSLLFEIALAEGDIQYIRENASKNLDLSNTELMNSLARTKDKQISEIILGLLSEEGKSIPARPALGMIKSDSYGKLDSSYGYYVSSVENYNDACRTILDIAVSSKNQYLAQRAVSKVMSNIVYKDLGDWETVVVKSGYSSLYNAYKVTLDNTEANAIKAAYQEAVRSGAFK